MRTLLGLFGLLLFTSCSEERRLLNRIEGVFETTEFVVTDDATGNVLFTASPTWQFAECGRRSNSDEGQCLVTITEANGASYSYRYQLSASNQDTDFISFRISRESADIENDLTRALGGALVIDIRDNELRMFTNDQTRGGRRAIQGIQDYQVSIIATKR